MDFYCCMHIFQQYLLDIYCMFGASWAIQLFLLVALGFFVGTALEQWKYGASIPYHPHNCIGTIFVTFYLCCGMLEVKIVNKFLVML